MSWKFFLVFAFLGWVVEVIYWLITERKFYFPGLFHKLGLPIPILPIYGCGALVLVWLHDLLAYENLALRIIAYVLCLTLFEYITAFLLEKVLGIKLWDYSKLAFNLHGRVSLLHSAYWLLAALAFEKLCSIIGAV